MTKKSLLEKLKAEIIAQQGFERIWHFMTASLLFPQKGKNLTIRFCATS
jgi:hypothetical protein